MIQSTIPKTIEQVANQLASGLNKKNPKTLADFLSSAAGQAIKYGGVLASTKANDRIVQLTNRTNTNIVRSNPQSFLGSNTTLIIIAGIVLFLLFSSRR